MSYKFEFTEAQIERMLQDGIKSAITSMLSDRFGHGAKLKKSVEGAIAQSEPMIIAALTGGISQACVSPGFLQSIEKEIAASMANQFRGTFDVVIRAAAKQAANTEVIAQRVAELTKQAAGL